MAKTTTLVGLLLVVAGVIAWAVTDFASWTALLPAILGVVIAILGVAAQRSDNGRHAIHAALVVALLGLLGSITRLGGLADGSAAAITSLVVVVVCAVYLALGVRSFVTARRGNG